MSPHRPTPPGRTSGGFWRRCRRSFWPVVARLVRAPLLVLAALWFFIEEFGWHPLAAWLGGLTRWPPWARLEARIARLPPRVALGLFLVPAALLLPVKLLALQLIHGGRPMLGLAVIVAAKLVGTAIGGRLFLLMRPQLMRIRRFARALAWWRQTRRRVRRALAASAGWRAWQGLRVQLARWRPSDLARWVAARLASLRARLRKAWRAAVRAVFG